MRSSRTPWSGSASNLADPFASNPIRRSFGLVVGSSAIVLVAVRLNEPITSIVMLSIGWLALTGIVMGIPILLLSLVEEAWIRMQRRRYPRVDQLDLSPRILHVLRRHGYESIQMIEHAPDTALLLMSNMDARGLHDVRRAVRLWRYRRWQEGGFR